EVTRQEGREELLLKDSLLLEWLKPLLNMRPNPADAGGDGNVQGCMHKTFMNRKPHPFNGTEGVVGLRRWIEKVEHVFKICKCAEEDKVKFAASTFEGRALTW
ncbi:hypothetical protein Tco_1249388, partial [Tanacetum coccineum]